MFQTGRRRRFWARPPTRQPEPELFPLPPRITDVDPQLASPLFNGRIPAEIRTKILEYALTEYYNVTPPTEVSAVSLFGPGSWPTDTHYTRPGFLAPKTISVSILLACRRIYLETWHLPYVSKSHVFWHQSPDRAPPAMVSSNGNESRYLARFRVEDQLPLIKSLHMFAQMYWLEGSFVSFCRKDNLQHIEELKITFRRSDWWNWESRTPLGINPQQNDCSAMRNVWKTEARGDVVEYLPDAWGSGFQHLKSLKTVVIEFETAEDSKHELDEIIEHAKNWRFPFSDATARDEGTGQTWAVKRVLSAQGEPVREGRWRGPPVCWADGEDGSPENEEMKRLKHLGKGPWLVTRTLTWRVALENPQDANALLRN